MHGIQSVCIEIVLRSIIMFSSNLSHWPAWWPLRANNFHRFVVFVLNGLEMVFNPICWPSRLLRPLFQRPNRELMAAFLKTTYNYSCFLIEKPLDYKLIAVNGVRWLFFHSSSISFIRRPLSLDHCTLSFFSLSSILGNAVLRLKRWLDHWLPRLVNNWNNDFQTNGIWTTTLARDIEANMSRWHIRNVITCAIILWDSERLTRSYSIFCSSITYFQRSYFVWCLLFDRFSSGSAFDYRPNHEARWCEK